MKARRNSRRRATRRSSGDREGGDFDRPLNLLGPQSVETDPLTGLLAEIRSIQPHAAQKTYICPGCNQEIRPGVGHLVVVPLAEPSERRHWHTRCWQHRSVRRPGR